MVARPSTRRSPIVSAPTSPAGPTARDPRVGRVVKWGGALLAAVLLVGFLGAGGSAEAAYPGLNGRIACEGARAIPPSEPPPAGFNRSEIFTVNPDGSDERVLTHNTVRDGDPRYSPDGTKIVFESARDGNSEIYVGNADGDLDGPDVKRLTFNAATGVAGIDRQPSFSPDGREIVFHSFRPAEFPTGTSPAADGEIYKTDVENGEADGPARRLTFSRGQDGIPEWSPNGRIAFQSLREAAPGRSQNLEIFTMAADGSDVRNVSNNPGTQNDPNTSPDENSNGIDSFPAWSPDGTRIAFGTTRDNTTAGNQNFEIYTMNADGSGQKRLTLNLSGDTPLPQPHIDYDHVPAWSPDGTRIVFHSGRASTDAGDEYAAYTMDSAAGEAAGLDRVALTGIFARCDWRPIPPAEPQQPPPGGGSPPGQPPSTRPPGVTGPTFGQVVRLPSARRCVRRRRLTVGIRNPRGDGVAAATVKVNRRTVLRVRGRRVTSRLVLRRLPRGRFTVTVTVRMESGRTLSGKRRYRGCPRRR